MTSYNIIDDTFSSVTSFGNPVFYILALMLSFIFAVPFALNLLSGLMFIEILCAIVKLIWPKERPIPQSKEGFLNNIDANSFPSVHSARIALLGAMFILYYRNIFISMIAVVVILAVGYSRVYLKRHDYIDVIFGFLIGISVAVIALYVL